MLADGADCRPLPLLGLCGAGRVTCVDCGQVAEHKARSLCETCYAKWRQRKNRNPDTWGGWPRARTLFKNQGTTCEIHVSRPAYSRGMCRSCYEKWRRLVRSSRGFWDQVKVEQTDRLQTLQGRTV